MIGEARRESSITNRVQVIADFREAIEQLVLDRSADVFNWDAI